MQYTRILAGRLGASVLARRLRAAGLSRAHAATVVVETLDLPEVGRDVSPISRDEVDRVRDEVEALWNELDAPRGDGERRAA